LGAVLIRVTDLDRIAANASGISSREAPNLARAAHPQITGKKECRRCFRY
jgi:hypothetical protein